MTFTAQPPTKFRVFQRRDIDSLPWLAQLPESERQMMKVVSAVLPFRVNEYVMEELIDWDRGGVLRFASELKAFVQDQLPKVSSEAIADYLRFDYVPVPLSIFEGIKKLASGTVLIAEGEAEPRIAE